jgi:hypothetical protein
VTFGLARVTVGPEGGQGLRAKEWFGTLVFSPAGFKQFVRNAQNIVEVYEKEWGVINDLPVAQEPARHEG